MVELLPTANYKESSRGEWRVSCGGHIDAGAGSWRQRAGSLREVSCVSVEMYDDMGGVPVGLL